MTQVERVEHPEVQEKIDKYYQEYLNMFEVAKTFAPDERTAAQAVLKAIDDDNTRIRIKFNGCPAMMIVDYAFDHDLYEWGLAAKMFRELVQSV